MINIISDVILCMLFNYHIICGFSAAQIRFPAVSDLAGTDSGVFGHAFSLMNVVPACTQTRVTSMGLSPTDTVYTVDLTVHSYSINQRR
ncbi:hypothetical protein SERMPC_00080 (plasmid) [Serratia marcescens]|nr:hypothetical protein BSR00_24525 [Serratia liquefaciens]RYM76559.1 hypothetical protein BSR01_21135 [Serratia liquefaciens]